MDRKPVGLGYHLQTHRTMNALETHEYQDALKRYLAEIKQLAAENETLRIQLTRSENTRVAVETKLRRAEDYNANLAARCDAVGVQED